MGQPARYPTVLAVWVNRSSETSAVAVQTNFVSNHIRRLSHAAQLVHGSSLFVVPLFVVPWRCALDLCSMRPTGSLGGQVRRFPCTESIGSGFSPSSPHDDRDSNKTRSILSMLYCRCVCSGCVWARYQCVCGPCNLSGAV